MTTQEIQESLQVVFDNFGAIENSEAFKTMMADPEFLVDGRDVDYLSFLLESMICSVRAYNKINEKPETQTTGA